MLAAVEWSSKRDYQADCRVWEARVQHIVKTVSRIPGVEAEMYYRKIGNEVPHAAVRWDEKAFGLTRQDVVEALRRGEPQIEVVGGQSRGWFPRIRQLLHLRSRTSPSPASRSVSFRSCPTRSNRERKRSLRSG